MKKHILFQGVLGTVLVILAAIDVSASSAAAMRRARAQAGIGQTVTAGATLAQYTNVSAAEAATIGVSGGELAQGLVNAASSSGAVAAEQLRNRGLKVSDHAPLLDAVQKVEAVIAKMNRPTKAGAARTGAGGVWPEAGGAKYNVSVGDFISAIRQIHEGTHGYPLLAPQPRTLAEALLAYGLPQGDIVAWLAGRIAHVIANPHDKPRFVTELHQTGVPVEFFLIALDYQLKGLGAHGAAHHDPFNGGHGGAGFSRGLAVDARTYGYTGVQIAEGIIRVQAAVRAQVGNIRNEVINNQHLTWDDLIMGMELSRDNNQPHNFIGVATDNLFVALSNYGMAAAEHMDFINALIRVRTAEGKKNDVWAEMVIFGAPMPATFYRVVDAAHHDHTFLNELRSYGVSTTTPNQMNQFIERFLSLRQHTAVFNGSVWGDCEAMGLKLAEFIQGIEVDANRRAALGGGGGVVYNYLPHPQGHGGGVFANLWEALNAYGVPVGTPAEKEALVKTLIEVHHGAPANVWRDVDIIIKAGGMSAGEFLDIVENHHATINWADFYHHTHTVYGMPHVELAQGVAELGRIKKSWGNLSSLGVQASEYVHGFERAFFGKKNGRIPAPESVETWPNVIEGGMSAIEFVRGLIELEGGINNAAGNNVALALNNGAGRIYGRALLDGMDKEIFAATIFVIYQEDHPAGLLNINQHPNRTKNLMLDATYKMPNGRNERDNTYNWLIALKDTTGNAIDFRNPAVAAVQVAMGLDIDGRLIPNLKSLPTVRGAGILEAAALGKALRNQAAISADARVLVAGDHPGAVTPYV